MGKTDVHVQNPGLMKILVFNCGSSSIKFRLMDAEKETVLVSALIENIAALPGERPGETKPSGRGIIHFKCKEKHTEKSAPVRNHEEGIQLALETLTECGMLSDHKELYAIGHRVVHGGEYFRDTVWIDDDVENKIESLCDLAPLHNPPNLSGIRACRAHMPGVPNAAVFDTAFHQTLPPKAYMYPLPYELYKKFGIRKYGFHGISHKYISHQAARILNADLDKLKIITCHLGAGSSLCAVDGGKSVETTMGFTPLEGLMMGTRPGSFDPEIIMFLLKKGYSLAEVEDMIQKKSGLMGISEHSYDVRDLHDEDLAGDPKAKLALEMYVYRVQRFLGSYTAVLGGLDLLVFSGGIGEKAYYLRDNICQPLEFHGVKLDQNSNKNNDMIISTKDSRVTVMVVPTNEELQIAREIVDLKAPPASSVGVAQAKGRKR